jgi:hypothetical protein
MADDAHEERFAYYDDILRRLTAILVRQDAINEELRTFNRQQVEINADVKTTLARVETLLARILPPGENGREA